MKIRVSRDIAGSRLCVFIGHNTYIDVRKDVRKYRCEVAEVVRLGHVVEYVPLQPRYAPETIVKLMRHYARH